MLKLYELAICLSFPLKSTRYRKTNSWLQVQKPFYLIRATPPLVHPLYCLHPYIGFLKYHPNLPLFEFLIWFCDRATLNVLIYLIYQLQLWTKICLDWISCMRSILLDGFCNKKSSSGEVCRTLIWYHQHRPQHCKQRERPMHTDKYILASTSLKQQIIDIKIVLHTVGLQCFCFSKKCSVA